MAESENPTDAKARDSAEQSRQMVPSILRTDHGPVEEFQHNSHFLRDSDKLQLKKGDIEPAERLYDPMLDIRSSLRRGDNNQISEAGYDGCLMFYFGRDH